MKIMIVGGGPAGFFAAISAAKNYPQHEVMLIEKNRQLLSKVRISGGGRCNVTHACFDPSILIKSYPRGGNELRGPFTRFQASDTIRWFEEKGVKLKIEEDGRMFPTTDQSETIIQCLQKHAQLHGVKVVIEKGLNKIIPQKEGFLVELSDGTEAFCHRILLSTGSHPKTYEIVQKLGHTVIPLVPSLFTFNIPDSPLVELAGVACPYVKVSLPELKMEQAGPVLITHWGISGPAVLKLSAWAARELHALNYRTHVVLDWFPNDSTEQLRSSLLEAKNVNKLKFVSSESPLILPKQLWKKIVEMAGINVEQRWSHLSNKQLQQLLLNLKEMQLTIDGKTTYKQEFVTCGGIDLKEVNFKKMESRLIPGIFFAGEILNIDGITGGFNFQNAWTTGWIAGHAIGEPV